MRRSFSVVANSGHLHMHLWGELHGGIRALGLSLCQSEDFILTKASDDIGAVNLSSVSLRVRIRVGIASGVGIASRVGVAVRVSIASAISITAAVNVMVGGVISLANLTSLQKILMECHVVKAESRLKR